ncbi:hypothetical protein [Brevibacillus porteri]|uniref:hypothetical protein n=1 Tax=Brevibacillus porteri TaxID=2126350 RepID=UPI0036310C59
MPSLDDVQNKLEKLWDYLDDMPVDKSEEEMNDLIVVAMDQIQEVMDDVNEIKYEMDEVEIKIQNINKNV